MNSFLDSVFWDNTVRSYLIVAGSILLFILIKRFLSRFIAGLLFRLVRRMARGVDKASFVTLVASPLEIFLLLLIIIIAFDKLSFPQVLNKSIYKITTQELFDAIALIVLIGAFTWLVLRIIDFVAMIMHRRSDGSGRASEGQLVVFFKDFFKVLVMIAGALMIMKFVFHFDISSLVTGLSIATAAIALSTRESLENLIASFIIFFDKPFTIGDTVKVHDITGTVEKIGLRSTRMRTDQKTFVTVPNKQMVDSIMDNLSLRSQRRAFVQLELHAETAHDSVNRFILQVKGMLEQRKDKVESYTVFLSDISKNAFILHLEFFTAPVPVNDFNALRQEVNLAVIELLEDMNIRLASKDIETKV